MVFRFLDKYVPYRRRAFVYGLVMLALWGFLLADICYLTGVTGGSATLSLYTTYFLLIAVFAMGPVIAFEARHYWRKYGIGPQENKPRDSDGYHDVQLYCIKCGWFRYVGYCGREESRRALIRLSPAKSPCNVLHATILIVASDVPVPELVMRHPGFRDMAYDRLNMLYPWREGPYRKWLSHRPCPRCKARGGLHMALYNRLRWTCEDRSRYRSWREINTVTQAPTQTRSQ